MNDTTTNDAGPGAQEQLVDRCWQDLVDKDDRTSPEDYPDMALITRAELADYMTDASLLAIDDVEAGERTFAPNRPVPALLQSLKVMGEQAGEEGRQGWTIICQRAISCIEAMASHVTRFLEYQGLAVRHPTMDNDLSVVAVRVHEDGRFFCTCRVMGSDQGEFGQWQFPLQELNAAGLIDDAVRIMSAGMVRAVMEDSVGQLVKAGGLPGLVMPEPVAWLRTSETGGLLWANEGEEGAFAVYAGMATALVDDQPDPPRGHAQDDHMADHCNGCDVPEAERVNLPEGWTPGDIVPSGLTVHWTLRDLRRFVFVGDPARQQRHYFPGSYPTQAEVHDLQAHPEYVMDPGGAHTEPNPSGALGDDLP